jgi:cell division protein FtsL
MRREEVFMRGEAFEYAIKKDVRNNPIVREVDRERYRELWRTTYIGLFLVAVLVFSIWRQFLLSSHGTRLDELEGQRSQLQREGDLLRVDLQKQQALARIQRIAKEQLQMIEPGPDDHHIIPVARPGSPPPGTAIAQR